MTGMQHYTVMTSLLRPFDAANDAVTPTFSAVVLASDAEAAIKAAAEHAVAEHIALADKVFAEMLRQAEAKGQRDMLERAIAALDHDIDCRFMCDEDTDERDIRQQTIRDCIAALRESRAQLTRPPLGDSKKHLLPGIDHAIVVLEDHLTYGDYLDCRCDALHLDPCDCDDCRAAVEHLAELEIDRMREER